MSPTTGEVAVAAGAGAVSRRGRPRRQYKCQHCAKVFKRSEHCVRHERTHTHEKPFVCRYCYKSYSRKDLVTRHERTLHAHGQPSRENVADQVTVAWAPPVLRPASLETPPRDIDEPLEDQNGDLEGPDGLVLIRGAETSPRSLPLPTHQETMSPSSSSSASSASSATSYSNEAAASRRDTTTAFFSLEGTGQSGSARAIAETTTITNGIHNPRNPSPTTATIPTDNQPRPSNPSTQDPMSFVFSPMPPADLDITAFTFSPLPSHIFELPQDQRSLLVMDDFELQSLPMNHLDALPELNQPQAQVVPDFDATRTHSSYPDPEKQTNQPDLPLLLSDGPPACPVVTLDSTAYFSIRTDLMQRLGVTDAGIDIPSAKICQGFLSSYISCFHGHLRIVHLQTFDPKTTPSPLVLAMCSIGALYRLDRRRARHLYDMAVRSVETIAHPSHDDDKALIKEYSLWYVQARMLLSFYAIMSGDKTLISNTMQDNGFYTLVFNKVRVSVGRDKLGRTRMTWHDWIEHESWKRLLAALFIASTLTMVLFHVNPGFNATQDLEFETLDDEALWNAESSNKWRELRANSSCLKQQLHHAGRRTLKEVLIDIMLPGRYRARAEAYQVSAFSALVLMHAVVLHMWQRFQVFQAFAEPWNPSLDQQHLRSSLLDSALQSLSRCEAFLRSGETDANQTGEHEDRETSLVFNCHAVLRIAYIRLFAPAGPSNRITLMSLDPVDTEASITSFVTAKMDRSPQLLEAVAKSFEGLTIPVRLGHMLVRKTAAFRWGVEHAVAGWESALLVTKWIHSVELDLLNNAQLSPGEQDLLVLIKEVLEEAEYDGSESCSLAAGVARTWVWFLQDVWIWAITPRMGSTLGLLADAYERISKSNRRRSFNGGS